MLIAKLIIHATIERFSRSETQPLPHFESEMR
jgi:hypothetical protein